MVPKFLVVSVFLNDFPGRLPIAAVRSLQASFFRLPTVHFDFGASPLALILQRRAMCLVFARRVACECRVEVEVQTHLRIDERGVGPTRVQSQVGASSRNKVQVPLDWRAVGRDATRVHRPVNPTWRRYGLVLHFRVCDLP